jgi:hypothetical protein
MRLRMKRLLKAVSMMSFFSLSLLLFTSTTQGQWSSNSFIISPIDFNYHTSPQNFSYYGNFYGNFYSVSYGPCSYSWSPILRWHGWPYSCWCGNGSVYTSRYAPSTSAASTMSTATTIPTASTVPTASTIPTASAVSADSTVPATLTVPAASTMSTATLTVPYPSMKGYEIYSWPAEDDWYFTVIIGTNRLKTYEEITSAEDVITEDGWKKVTVKGVDSVKAVLSQLPKGEQVSWIGSNWLKQVHGATGNLTLPDQRVIDNVEMYCNEVNVELHILP